MSCSINTAPGLRKIQCQLHPQPDSMAASRGLSTRRRTCRLQPEPECLASDTAGNRRNLCVVGPRPYEGENPHVRIVGRLRNYRHEALQVRLQSCKPSFEGTNIFRYSAKKSLRPPRSPRLLPDLF